MKVSTSTGSLYLFPLKWALDVVAGAGFDGIELAVSVEAVARGPEAVRGLAEVRDLRVLSVHPPLLSLPGWNSFADTAKMVDFAARVGASVVVQHTPNSRSLDGSEGMAWQRAMEEARRRGEERGVTLALENRAVFRNEQRSCALADPESLHRFAQEHDFPLTLDTSHAASWSWDSLDVYELFRDRLVNLHLSDFKALPAWLDRPALHTYIKHHQLLGSGDLPLLELLSRVQTDGYTGLVTLELSPLALQAWWPARLRRNLAASVSFVRHGLMLPAQHQPIGQPASSRVG